VFYAVNFTRLFSVSVVCYCVLFILRFYLYHIWFLRYCPYVDKYVYSITTSKKNLRCYLCLHYVSACNSISRHLLSSFLTYRCQREAARPVRLINMRSMNLAPAWWAGRLTSAWRRAVNGPCPDASVSRSSYANNCCRHITYMLSRSCHLLSVSCQSRQVHVQTFRNTKIWFSFVVVAEQHQWRRGARGIWPPHFGPTKQCNYCCIKWS